MDSAVRRVCGIASPTAVRERARCRRAVASIFVRALTIFRSGSRSDRYPGYFSEAKGTALRATGFPNRVEEIFLTTEPSDDK